MSRGSRPRSLKPAVAQAVLESVLLSLASPKTQAAYRAGILDFLRWWERSSLPLVPATLEAWRSDLTEQKLAASSVNQRLSAVRLFFRHAKERGALGGGQAADLIAVANLKSGAQRASSWLTVDEAGKLLAVPDPHTLLGKRDRAMLALLVACGLRREELVHLEVKHLHRREDRWVLAIKPAGEGRHRTVPLPRWVKASLDRWLEGAGIRRGFLFRRLRRNGELDEDPSALSDDSVYLLVKTAGAAIGKPELTPHELRRTCAQLCREAGGGLEEIQLLLGHASIQTTERYLGARQEWGHAVNDRVRIRVRRKPQ